MRLLDLVVICNHDCYYLREYELLMSAPRVIVGVYTPTFGCTEPRRQKDLLGVSYKDR